MGSRRLDPIAEAVGAKLVTAEVGFNVLTRMAEVVACHFEN